MNIEVLFFAQLRETLGTDRQSVNIGVGDTVADVVRMLSDGPDWRSVGKLPMTFAVNEQVVEASHALNDGDRLALLTPVSGG